MVESLELLVKGLERSKNIKGDIVHSLWRVLTELTAMIAILGTHAMGASGDPGTADTYAMARELRDLKKETRDKLCMGLELMKRNFVRRRDSAN